MNEKLEEYLCKKYPKILVERKLSPMESCMGRGIECGDGYFLLIDSLCHSIQQYIDSHNNYLQEGEVIIPQVIFTQVKEKFGNLRVYHDGGDPHCQGLIDGAECMSCRTCENCGTFSDDVGRVTKGWIQGLCTECAKEYEKEIVHNEEIRKLLATVRASRKNPKRSWPTFDELYPEPKDKTDVKRSKKTIQSSITQRKRSTSKKSRKRIS